MYGSNDGINSSSELRNVPRALGDVVLRCGALCIFCAAAGTMAAVGLSALYLALTKKNDSNGQSGETCLVVAKNQIAFDNFSFSADPNGSDAECIAIGSGLSCAKGQTLILDDGVKIKITAASGWDVLDFDVYDKEGNYQGHTTLSASLSGDDVDFKVTSSGNIQAEVLPPENNGGCNQLSAQPTFSSTTPSGVALGLAKFIGTTTAAVTAAITANGENTGEQPNLSAASSSGLLPEITDWRVVAGLVVVGTTVVLGTYYMAKNWLFRNKHEKVVGNDEEAQNQLSHLSQTTNALT